MNIYSQTIKNNLNKVFNLYDLDHLSNTYGFGDRDYWGWKVKDFVNGSMQGGVHTLAIALKSGIIENNTFTLKVIDAAILAVNKIHARNGSMVEAYPDESSFCVTALVAFDILSAIKHLEEQISDEKRKQYLKIVRPLILFLTKNDEKHAIISNHVATAVAALALWNKFTGEGQDRCNELLLLIYDNQSDEGWYREYEGADPGYQTLCTYYLFCAYEEAKCPQLLDSLEKSLQYLKYFVHPDGTIGGLYGSRNTEVCYLGGIVGLSQYSETAKLIVDKLGFGIEAGNNLLPQDIDIGNFIPLLNSYAVACLYSGELSDSSTEKLPYEQCGEWLFEDSGIYVKSTKRYYAIVNFHKGGTIKVFDKIIGLLDADDGGLFGKLNNGNTFSTQQKEISIDFKDTMINAGFYIINSSLPTPFTTIVLRMLSLTVFKSTYIGNLFKKIIVKMLMTGKSKIDGKVIRKFLFTEENIVIEEKISKPKGCVKIEHSGKSRAIHMASSGYYMRSHEKLVQTSKIVTFRTSV